MGSLVMYTRADGAIFFSAKEGVQEGELSVPLHCELYARINTAQSCGGPEATKLRTSACTPVRMPVSSERYEMSREHW